MATFTALKERTFSATNLATRSAEPSLVSALFSSKQWRDFGDSAGHIFSRRMHQNGRIVWHRYVLSVEDGTGEECCYMYRCWLSVPGSN